ncbi:FAD-dependent monooxygenase [Prochlorococcus sp. MIT 1307]|uniref:FAD-dependent monooxygenase n=1 Tax=Prochlorococcus sp. MIT 1307 TaxID=3096219 RepID=UPI002A7620A6|nr:FAD-dependent monooxygenase [Prochlorococcus sp. MIT 1307]
MIKTSIITILGSGPTGATLALALACSGSTINLYDPKLKHEIASKSRAYALSQSTRILLKQINIWDKLEPYLISFDKLLIFDDENEKEILFNPTDLDYDEHNDNSIGWIIEHENLMNTLFTEIDNLKQINTHFGHSLNYQYDSSELIIAADGTNSMTRNNWGIDLFGTLYKQGCITAKILFRGSDMKTAYEIFRSEGPLAILPMGNDIYQVIWTAPFDLCLTRVEQNESRFLDSLASILPYNLEPDVLVEKPCVFPVKLSIAKQFYKGKGFLVGECAHSCHPVGGQGLNLCLRDVEELSNLLKNFNKQSRNLSKIQHQYSVNRFFDIVSVLIITDLLVRVFSTRNPLVIKLRYLVLKLVDSIPIIKKVTLKIMTYGPTKTFFSNSGI